MDLGRLSAQAQTRGEARGGGIFEKERGIGGLRQIKLHEPGARSAGKKRRPQKRGEEEELYNLEEVDAIKDLRVSTPRRDAAGGSAYTVR